MADNVPIIHKGSHTIRFPVDGETVVSLENKIGHEIYGTTDQTEMMEKEDREIDRIIKEFQERR